ncbi:hypothetical protein [Thalassomonas actiniarum]|uniref:Uncharacterized protein n=1 Tax=Thalassomonas actiniarum TaxID=485447 RepID=A0AAE9YWK2_9GAMM|nr:hypothetical protein [Thalassomonas actiniarum]WDE02511.1 hypothetical protein SG35_029325 [Thalassomonas actiniarum]
MAISSVVSQQCASVITRELLSSAISEFLGKNNDSKTGTEKVNGGNIKHVRLFLTGRSKRIQEGAGRAET